MTKLRKFLFLSPAAAKTNRTDDTQVVFEEHTRLSMYNPQDIIRKMNLIGRHLQDLTDAVQALQDNTTTDAAPKSQPKTTPKTKED